MILGGSIDTQLVKVTLQLCWDYLWQCWSRGSQSTLNLGSHFATLLEIDTQLGNSLCWDYFLHCWSWWGVNWHSTWEVTLQLCWDYPWQCWSWVGGGQLTLKFGSHFATLLGLPLTMLILEGGQSTFNLGSHFATLLGLLLTMLILGAGGSINTQLWKSLCNFAGVTSDNVDPGRGSINTQLGKSLCNFAGITSDNVDPRGSQIDTELGKSLCNFAGITSDNAWSWGGGGQLTLNLGSHFATLLGLPLTMLILGGRGSIDTQVWKSLCNFAGITSDNDDPGVGLIDTQLGRSLCNFVGITSENVDPGGGFDQHSTWEVTLQLCCDYLWQCWSWGGGQSILKLWSHFATLLWLLLNNVDPGDGQSILNLGSHFATWLGLPLTMLILGGGSIDTQVGKSLCNFAGITFANVDPGVVNQHSTWEVSLQICWDYLWQCWSWGVDQHSTWKVTLQLCWDNLWLMLIPGGSINTQLGKSLCNFAGITSDNVDLGGSIDTQLGRSLFNFAGITSNNVDPRWGVNQHSTWEVTLQLCWDYL